MCLGHLETREKQRSSANPPKCAKTPASSPLPCAKIHLPSLLPDSTHGSSHLLRLHAAKLHELVAGMDATFARHALHSREDKAVRRRCYERGAVHQ